MSGTVEVRDYVLWTKHIHDAAELRMALDDALPPESTVQLKIAGALGVWRKMRANVKTKAATPGLQPLGEAQTAWRSLYQQRISGGLQMVPIELADSKIGLTRKRAGSPREQKPTAEERRAAWEAIRDLWRTGSWSSAEPYSSRDELYEQ